MALLATVGSSASGLLVAVTIARSSTVDATGRYAVAAAAMLLVTALARSAVADPLTAASSAPGVLRRTGRASAIGLGGVAVLGTVAVLLRSDYLAVGAIAIHGLAMRDTVRAVLLARGAAVVAVVGELVGVGSTAVAFSGTLLGLWGGLTAFAVWAGFGALLGYVMSIVTTSSLRPSWQDTPIPTARSLAFGGDTMIGSGVVQVVTWIATAIGGLSVAAALRGAGTLAGPVTVGLTAARAVLIPHAVRRLDGGDAVRGLVRDTAKLCALAAPALVLLAVVPAPIGVALLGATWPLVAPILMWTAIELFAQLVAAVPESAHRAIGAGRRILALRCSTALIRIPLVLLVAPAGVGAVVVAAAAVTTGSAVIWWISLVTLTRRPVSLTTSD
jgi:O-antigen/teichoic acid export membrane protein